MPQFEGPTQGGVGEGDEVTGRGSYISHPHVSAPGLNNQTKPMARRPRATTVSVNLSISLIIALTASRRATFSESLWFSLPQSVSNRDDGGSPGQSGSPANH